MRLSKIAHNQKTRRRLREVFASRELKKYIKNKIHAGTEAIAAGMFAFSDLPEAFLCNLELGF